MVLLLDELDGEGRACKFGWKDGLHAVRHIALLVEKLLNGIRDGRGFDVTVGVEHGCRIGLVVGHAFWCVGMNDEVRRKERAADDDCSHRNASRTGPKDG